MVELLFDYVLRKSKYLQSLKHNQPISIKDPPKDEGGGTEEPIPPELHQSVARLREMLGEGADVKVHPLKFGPQNSLSGAIVFIDGLVNAAMITEAILRPVKAWQAEERTISSKQDLILALELEVLCSGEVALASHMAKLAEGCLCGDTVLLVDGCESALVISTKGWDMRSVTEPTSESVVRGPREGFTENLRTNTGLIRRKIRGGKLKMEHMTVGRQTRTAVCILYIEDIAKPEVVEKVRYRIGKLDVDSILETGYIEEYIEDAPFSPFATINYSEKPDVVAAQMLEGRVAIVVDGTPFVLTVPMLFIESFQTAEDYYIRPLYASLLRIIRFLAFLITVFAPGVYIALTEFHPELIPTTLLFSIVKAREGTPFPAFLEAMVMIFAFEILREAGIRMPRPVGQAISIVGALIMGDAAVNAGIVGAPMVIIVAITAVSGYLVPNQSDSASIVRVMMMILGATFGFYGITLGFLGLLIHLATLESFGVPFFDSFGRGTDLQDVLIRMPQWSMKKRPVELVGKNSTRIQPFLPPLRPFSQEQEEEE